MNLSLTRRSVQDIICGLTVGVMSIPQGTPVSGANPHHKRAGIAYALLSGLPPIFGLYTSFVPPMLYVFFGQSPQISMGWVDACVDCAHIGQVPSH